MNFPLEDSTTDSVPAVLTNIIEQLLSNSIQADLMQKDIFFILILVLMLENGFMPIKNVSLDNISHVNVSKLIQSQRESGFYKETFILSGLHAMTVDIIMSPVGSAVIVNAAINYNSSEIYSICLPVSRYVVAPKASTIAMMFRDLKHLTNSYKNQIITPVKSRILNYCGYPSASLVGLPEDIFFSLMMLLNIQDILNVSKACRRLKAILENECFWHALCKRDFKSLIQNDRGDWKTFYKQNYIAEQEKKLPQLAGTIHDLMDISDMVSYIDNPLWGDIL